MPATTYTEFEKSPSREPRFIVSLRLKNASTGFFKFIYLSTIAGPRIDNPAFYYHGVVGRVPVARYSSKEISGALPIPTYSDLELIVPDGYDLSEDGSGIYIDDFGSTWIVRDQSIGLSFGGDDVPFTQYQPVMQAGTVEGFKRTDTGGILSISGPEKEIYRKTMAANKIDSIQYPNAAENLGKSKPVCIGFCYNVKPRLVDTVTNQWMFNENSSYTFLQVFDNCVTLGSPGQYVDNGDGTFTLTYTPTGQITCSVLGASGSNPWATVITDVLQNYGGIVPSRIDSVAVTAANIALPYSVGHYVPDETPVMDVISKLSQGIPAWWGFNAQNVFTMREVAPPSSLPTTKKIANTTSAEIPVAFIDGSLTESPSGKVTWKVDFEYYQNYTPTSWDRVAAVNKLPFVNQWRNVTPASDATVLTNYAFAASVKKFARAFIPAHASGLAAKWLALEKVERFMTTLTVPMMEIYTVGDIVELTYETKLQDGTSWYKHGYNAKKLLVLGVDYDFNNYTIKLELWA